jgi:hypothetical protein
MSFVPPVGPNSMGPDVAREQAREVASEAAKYACVIPTMATTRIAATLSAAC